MLAYIELLLNRPGMTNRCPRACDSDQGTGITARLILEIQVEVTEMQAQADTRIIVTMPVIVVVRSHYLRGVDMVMNRIGVCMAMMLDNPRVLIMAISVFAAVVEPGLNPNQPSQRMKTPRAARGRL